ncbi:MAG TPA: RNA pyrophosphohydrolase [Hyphomicrobiales bacterium]|jgi:putative (di)nucleoside polyphosphate hydrolase
MSRTGKPIDPSTLPYRACVGIMLLNPERRIWVGRRRSTFAEAGERWQMPQGGIDDAEPPAVAALRELSEETGTDKAEIVGESRGWHQYDIPPHLVGKALHGRYRGQKQKWFAMRFTGVDADFNIHNPPGGHEPEFDEWRWVGASELIQLIVPFKRQVYEAVTEEFRALLG